MMQRSSHILSGAVGALMVIVAMGAGVIPGAQVVSANLQAIDDAITCTTGDCALAAGKKLQADYVVDSDDTGPTEFTHGLEITASQKLYLDDNAQILLGDKASDVGAYNGLQVDESTARLNNVIAGTEYATKGWDLDSTYFQADYVEGVQQVRAGLYRNLTGTGAATFDYGLNIAAGRDLNLADNSRIMLGASNDGLIVDASGANGFLAAVTNGAESSVTMSIRPYSGIINSAYVEAYTSFRGYGGGVPAPMVYGAYTPFVRPQAETDFNIYDSTGSPAMTISAGSNIPVFASRIKADGGIQIQCTGTVSPNTGFTDLNCSAVDGTFLTEPWTP